MNVDTKQAHFLHPIAFENYGIGEHLADRTDGRGCSRYIGQSEVLWPITEARLCDGACEQG